MPDTLQNPEETDTQLGKPEKYSVQCLRQIYEDLQILLHEYDEMLQLCDHPQIGKYIETLLQRHVTDLEKLEDLIEKHHPGVKLSDDVLEDEDPALEDTDPALVDDEVSPDAIVDAEADLEEQGDTDSVPADSRLERLPDEDEVVEGMKRGLKTLDPKKTKSLLQKHKGLCKSCGKAECKCYPSKSFEDQERQAVENAEGEGNDDMLAPEPDSLSNYFEDAEFPQVSEAHAFLTELSGASAFDEGHRMKSFHYHKVLDSIIGAQAKRGGKKNLPAGLKGAGKTKLDIADHTTPDPEAHRQEQEQRAARQSAERAKHDIREGESYEDGDYIHHQNVDELRDRVVHGTSVHKLPKKKPAGTYQYDVSQPTPISQRNYRDSVREWDNLSQEDRAAAERRDSEARKKDMANPSGSVQANSSGSYTPDASAGFTNNPMEPGQKTLPPQYKACQDAGEYLGRMSRERAFGLRHREEAKQHAESLNPFLQSIDEANINTGQKSLLDVWNEQLREIEALDKRLDSLITN